MMKIRNVETQGIHKYYSSKFQCNCYEKVDCDGHTMYFYEESISKYLKRYFNKVNALDESNWSRVVSHVENGCMFISAYRDENTREENEQKTKELITMIRDKGLGYIPIFGGYVENKDTDNEVNVVEESFIVPQQHLSDEEFFEFAIECCKKFNQDSVLISLPGYCDFGYYNKSGKLDFSPGEKMIFSDSKIKEYFSMLKYGSRHHRKFAFAEWLAIRRAGSFSDKVYMSKYKEDIHLK